MKQITVTLGGRQFGITALNIAKSRAWREQFSAPFEVSCVTFEPSRSMRKIS